MPVKAPRPYLKEIIVTLQEAEDRIRHRVMAGMVDRSTFDVIIAKEEAHALLSSIYSALNSDYLDALQKGNRANKEEAALQSPDTLKMLNILRTTLKNKRGYNKVFATQRFTPEFGVELRVEE